MIVSYVFLLHLPSSKVSSYKWALAKSLWFWSISTWQSLKSSTPLPDLLVFSFLNLEWAHCHPVCRGRASQLGSGSWPFSRNKSFKTLRRLQLSSRNEQRPRKRSHNCNEDYWNTLRSQKDFSLHVVCWYFSSRTNQSSVLDWRVCSLFAQNYSSLLSCSVLYTWKKVVSFKYLLKERLAGILF